VSAVNASVEQSAAGDMGYLSLPNFPLLPSGALGFDASVHVSATPPATSTFDAANSALYGPPSLLHSSYSSSSGPTVVTPHASDFQRPLAGAGCGSNDFLAPAAPTSPTANARRSIDLENPFLSLAPTPSVFPGSPNSHSMTDP
jgi:hypothetical protein